MARLAGENTPEQAAPASSKPSWARKPAWAQKKAELQADDPKSASRSGDIEFSHAERAYDEIMAEKERRKRAKAAAKAKAEADDDSPRVKKRRISEEDRDDRKTAVVTSGYGDRAEQNPAEMSMTSRERHTASPLKSPSHVISDGVIQDALPERPIERSVIEIDSDSDDAVAHQAQKQDDDTYDPELRALVEEARAKQTQSTQKPASKPFSALSPESPRRTPVPPSISASAVVPTVEPATEPLPDPVVQILITSPIPDTNPLLVRRKISQRLREIREAWISRQQLPPAIHPDTVFLIWRNHRIFDSATCKNLGYKASPDGRAIAPRRAANSLYTGDVDFDDDEAEEGEETRMCVEAVTLEIFEERKRLAREGPAVSKDADDAADEDGGAVEGAGNADDGQRGADAGVKVMLRAPGYDEIRLLAKTDTLFERIANVFRSQRAVPPDKSIVLMHDGEKLDPGNTVGSSDIEDMDVIEAELQELVHDGAYVRLSAINATPI